MFTMLALKIKRQENGFYALLYRSAKAVVFFNIPTVKIIHLPLYHLDRWVRETARHLFHVCWSIPLFKARCERVGKNLRLPNGIPYLEGSNLRLIVGDNVTIGRSTIGASKIFDEAVLSIGSGSTIGYGSIISVSREVTIGDHCMIAPGCLIMDSDDHPVNPEKRLRNEPVDRADVLPVRIGSNVWIGCDCSVLKGVTIGDNAVIGTRSVVTRDVEQNAVYAGYPARPTLRNLEKRK